MRITHCMAAMALVMASAAGAAAGGHDEGDISFEISADYAGKYIWRGQNLSDDPVFQTGVAATKGNLTAGFWGNLDFSDINDRRNNFSELDYWLEWGDDLPSFGASYAIGLIYYDFPGSSASGSRVPDTTEVYGSLALDIFLSPSITVYHDLDEADGTYVSFGISHDVEKIAELFGAPVGFSAGAGLGWGSGSYNKYYWGRDGGKLNDLSFSVSFPVQFGSWTVSPNLNYVTLLGSTIRGTDVYNTASDYFFAGVGFSRSF